MDDISRVNKRQAWRRRLKYDCYNIAIKKSAVSVIEKKKNRKHKNNTFIYFTN